MQLDSKNRLLLVGRLGYRSVMPGLLGLILLVFFVVFGLRAYHFAQTAPISGEVVHKEIQQLYQTGNRPEVAYLVTMQFSASGGSLPLQIGQTAYDQLHIGDRVKVFYDPINPTKSEIVKGATGRVALAFGFATMVCLGWSGFWLIHALRKSTWMIAARDLGERRHATVTDIDRHLAGGRVKLFYAVRMYWRDEAGGNGRSLTRICDAAEIATAFPGLGDQIEIFVDPSRPEHAVWQGDVGSRAAH